MPRVMQRSKVLRSSQVSVPRPFAPVPRNAGRFASSAWRLLRLLGQRRYAAVRRINHQRGPRASSPSCRDPTRSRCRHARRRRACPCCVLRRRSVPARRFLHRRHFLGGEELPAVDVGRTLERRDRPIGERALKIGLTPRCFRRRVWFRRRCTGAAILGDEYRWGQHENAGEPIRTRCLSRMSVLPSQHGPAKAGHYVLKINLRGDLREPRREYARRRQPGATGDECLVIRLDRVGV